MPPTRLLLVVTLAALTVSATAHAASVGYGPSLAAPDLDTPPSALSDRPGGTDQVVPGVTRPNPVVTSAAVPTLSDALAEVYLTNPQLLAERARLRSTDENVPSALAGWRPQVTVQVSAGRGFGTLTDPQVGVNPITGVQESGVQNEDRTFNSEQMTITQPIYRGGRTTAQTGQAENEVRAERARLIAQEEQSFSDTVTAFVTVIEDQQLYQLQVSNAQVLAKQLDATNARFSVGEITRTDVAQAEAALAGAIAEREQAYGTLQTARSSYRRTIGEVPDKLIEPQPLALPIHSVEEADTLASTNNASVVAALYDDSSQKDAVDLAYAALLPQVSLTGTGGRNNQASEGNVSTLEGTVGVSATIPLYQGGAEYAAIRQAKQNEQQSRKTADDARRVAVQGATQYWEQYVAAKATVASTRAQIRADEIALDGVEREALAGTQTTLDVLNAEQLLLSARVTLVQNLATLVTASYQVAGAIGRLTARDLGLRVPLYDETAYYRAVRDLPFSDADHATAQPGR